jgi:hypothetical protein
MTTVDLVKRIEALPEAEKLAVARFVDSLTARLNSSPETPEHVYERIVGRAERIYALHGSIGDSTAEIRELRQGRQPARGTNQ